MKTETKSSKKENYIAPDVEVLNVEIGQNVLAGSGNGGPTDMEGEDW